MLHPENSRRAFVSLLRVMCSVVLVCLTPSGALATPTPDERLEDPELERRAQTVGRELRCVVCQSQSIEESDVPLAKDLRRLVRERIEAGASNQEVLDYVADRYGDYVLMRPPVRGSTLLLWGAPGLALLGGGVIGFMMIRRGKAVAPASPASEGSGLSPEEVQKLAALERDTTAPPQAGRL